MKYSNNLYIIIIITAILLLSSCQTTKTKLSQPLSIDHIGCQEQEIDINGKCLIATENNAQLFEQELDLYVDSTIVEGGFLAKPKQQGTYPGIIMVHEWWGLNDNIKYMAKLLAKEGYIVFAVDLYDGQVAADSTTAGKLAGNVRNDPQQAILTLKKSVEYLRTKENTPKVASLGWCFGGGQSLQLALNEKLDATVIYYGQLINDKEQLKKIEWPILGIFGEKDTSIPVSTVEEFRSALNELKIEHDIKIFPGVGHAFANPSGSNYAKNETFLAWSLTLSFLNDNLKTETAAKTTTPLENQLEKIIPSISVESQTIKNNSVTIQNIIAPKKSWIVIHNQENGKVGSVIGFTTVEQGNNDNIVVNILSTEATEQLYAMLHNDEPLVGEYDFPGSDIPTTVNGKVIVTGFNVTLPIIKETPKPNYVSPKEVSSKNMSSTTKEFQISADEQAYNPSTIIVNKGDNVRITFNFNDEKIYFGGLDIRSTFFNIEYRKSDIIKSRTVEFVAQESFKYIGYWPATNKIKATGTIEVR